MKRLLWSISIVSIVTGFFLFSAGLTYSQWIGFENPSVRLPPLLAGPFPNAGYPGAGIPQNYGPQPILYGGSVGPLGQNQYPPGIPPGILPGSPNPAYQNGWNGSYPWPNSSFFPPGANYSPNPGDQFAGGFYPNGPYPPSPPGANYSSNPGNQFPGGFYPNSPYAPPPYSPPWQGGNYPQYPANYSQLPGQNPYWQAPNFYPYLPWVPDDDSDDDSEESEPPSEVAGVWIGTWASTYVTSGDFFSEAASISLAQEEGIISGAVLFVGNSIIYNVSATGVVEGDEISMTAVVGSGESKKTISFKGEAFGDTWSGEYAIIDNNDVATELGEFVLSRI